MLKHFITVCLMIVSVNAVAQAVPSRLSMMPYPLSVQFQTGDYLLKNKMVITLSGVSAERVPVIKRSLNNLLAQHNIELLSEQNEQPDELVTQLFIEVNLGRMTDYQLPSLGVDESYQLKVNEQGIVIHAANDFGALHGMATLLQLIAFAANSPEIRLPLVTINDMPRFTWRGLLIDSVRHFIPISAIKRQLDGMVAAKLNVFHWYLTGDQGWRIESTRYPKLHQLASDGLYYTQAQIKEVVSYAANLGIRVVPEFNLPGGVSAIAVAYPELMAVNKPYFMEKKWGEFMPILDPSQAQTYQFISDIVAELSALFPDPYLHLGEDDINLAQWQEHEAIEQYKTTNNLADEQQLYEHFIQNVQQLLAAHDKKMLRRGDGYSASLTQAGEQVILSAGFNLAQAQASAYHYQTALGATHAEQPIKLSKDDQTAAWQFDMTAQNGSQVKGELVLVKRNGYVISAYVNLSEQGFEKVAVDRALALTPSQVNFSMDTLLGPMRGEFVLRDGQALSGRIRLGNTYFPVEGEQLQSFDISQMQLLPNVTKAQQGKILGGEALLWTELVNEDNIDRRIWPRLFAIAERLWSHQSVTDSQNMYQRLGQVSQYAEQIGILSNVQQQQGFQSLIANGTDINPLQIFAQQVEPAHSITRQNIKFNQGLAHQQAPLDHFVDFLPAESLSLVTLHQHLRAYQQGNISGLQQIVNTMRDWHVNFQPLVKLVKSNPKLSSIANVVNDARVINTVGLTIAQSCLAGVKMTKVHTKRIKHTLAELQQPVREIALSSGLLVQALLEVCRQ
ncbi:family 20 glycosylhydrolase [Thalassotalea sp. G2M2-11]|uniref:beta-N-acetylhexosaminidase n=1 Tax=Thalassotalea sp. G2M2-11 TaxID=2787627 RepID=UPI0019CFADA1|nr:family 20 glycosylhydrolase [Thalassotalea sp. G2M2-11]